MARDEKQDAIAVAIENKINTMKQNNQPAGDWVMRVAQKNAVSQQVEI